MWGVSKVGSQTKKLKLTFSGFLFCSVENSGTEEYIGPERANKNLSIKILTTNVKVRAIKGLNIELSTSRKKHWGGMKTKLGRWACLEKVPVLGYALLIL